MGDGLRLAILAAIIAAVAAALVTVGGPMQARHDKLDAARAQDLGALNDFVRCVARAQGALPETLDPAPGCTAGNRRTDPETGAAYVYRRIDSERFELCAVFHDLERLTRNERGYSISRIDPATGCLPGTLPED